MKLFLLLIFAGCAAPNAENYAQKYNQRSEMLENRQLPMSQEQLEENTIPLTGPEATPERP